MDAVRARAAGMSREEVNDLFKAELHDRGINRFRLTPIPA